MSDNPKGPEQELGVMFEHFFVEAGTVCQWLNHYIQVVFMPRLIKSDWWSEICICKCRFPSRCRLLPMAVQICQATAWQYLEVPLTLSGPECQLGIEIPSAWHPLGCPVDLGNC